MAIDELIENPRPMGYVPVQTAPSGTYRIRIGGYRVIYVVNDDEQRIIVARVAKRDKRTYRPQK